MAYVYQITLRTTGQFYIGFRSANRVPPHEDLLVKYFTSSRTMKKLIAENVHEIDNEILTEGSDDHCYWFEQELIKTNIENPLCVNKTFVDRSSGKKMFSMTSRTHTVETRQKMSKPHGPTGKTAWNAGKKASEESRAKMRAAKTGKPLTDAHRAKVSEALKGKSKKPFTDQHKANLRAAKLEQRQRRSAV